MDISLNVLPSKKYYDELKTLLSYDDLIFSVINEGGESFVSKWTSDLNTSLRGYLDEYESDITIINGTKRCRDLIDILDNIIKEIKKSDYHDSYEFTEQTINASIKSVVGTYCNTSSRNAIEDDVKENIKTVDDFMEDVKYIKENISEINSNPNCPKILSYLEMQNTIVKAILSQEKQEYSTVLTLHDESITRNYEDIVKKIICTSSESKAYLEGESSVQSQQSGGNSSTVAAISLPGISLIFFFLYKFTHLGTVFNNRIGKKIKFWNNTYEEPNEILDNNTEYLH
ncbi:PIR protein [Plasmodium ovale]|uniref:PIR protein n=1 Tax=Plasmodium ovale TaxID=36330 RepID=A0A1C3KK84_PLAOA|nr:PIR protein [Plasmodium ovale]